MTIRTRFAPSPTGHLHVGNIRTALHNWLLAQQAGGEFILRLDDTDAARSRDEFADGIRADLRWLGMVPDGEVCQSERFDLYEAKFEALKAAGRVYPCYETPQELELRRKILLGQGKPPIYERTALALSDEQRTQLEADGQRPHWRFKLDHDAPIVFDDLVRGEQKFDPALISDPVIRRADGSWLYMLPSAIDDIDMGITHIVRGEDHVTNSAAQLQMFAALGADAPQFAHTALLVGKEGKLSKRLGSLGVAAFRDKFIEPISVVALLARLGTSDPVEPFTDVAPLIEGLDFGRFGRAPARFDEAELEQLNQKVVHLLGYDAVADRLPDGMGAEGWDAIRPNIAHLGEVGDWWRLVTGPIAAADVAAEDADYVGAAAEKLADLPWSDTVWKDWTGALKDETGRKGKALFLPLRLALTGMGHGPDMAALLPLIGRDEALARLAAAQ